MTGGKTFGGYGRLSGDLCERLIVSISCAEDDFTTAGRS
jgi:hypothetical protein